MKRTVDLKLPYRAEFFLANSKMKGSTAIYPSIKYLMFWWHRTKLIISYTRLFSPFSWSNYKILADLKNNPRKNPTA